jgi:hypothetical protein
MVASGSVGIGGEPLHLVEVCNQSRVGIAAKERAGEDLSECWRVPPPALADERHECPVFLVVESRSRLRAATVRTLEDEVCNTLRVLNRVGRRGPSIFGYTK